MTLIQRSRESVAISSDGMASAIAVLLNVGADQTEGRDRDDRLVICALDWCVFWDGDT